MESTRNRALARSHRAAAHPHEADRRRDLRAVHPQELRRRQALLARGRREHDPDARPARRGGRRSTASKRSSSAWPTAGASTCSSTSWARTCARSSPRSTTRTPERFLGAGDVKYHLGYSTRASRRRAARNVHLSLAFNPSHLEFVNPVVEGRVRAKIDRRKRKSTMPLLIHGDAAFMGQGVVAETLNLAGLEGYTTGGTIHLVVNNQIGFTTVPSDSRSTRYCTDIARMLRVPVFHVNGEDPEAVIQVTRLAIEFRQRFEQDVVIDMYCYRKYGHNEGDEPRFTQPLMYALIDKKPTVREVYVARLVDGRSGHAARRPTTIAQERRATLERALEEARKGDFHRCPRRWAASGRPYVGGPDAAVPERSTAVPEGEAARRARQAHRACPPGFHANPKVLKLLEQRRERASAGQPLDWGTASTSPSRRSSLEGARRPHQRAGRAARHVHAPPRGALRHRDGRAATRRSRTWVARTEASAASRSTTARSARPGVLGFEYGYSARPPGRARRLGGAVRRLRERAQVIIDQFITSAEDKWSRLSGLVLLLPHGFEGQGPEHSSARIERFLQLARRGQHPGLQPDDAGAALPRAPPPGAPALAQAAHRLHAEDAPPASRGGQHARRDRRGRVPARHPRRRRSTARR